MKTFDGAKLVQSRLEKLYGRYPEGSISKRDVLITIPMDFDEEKIQKVNASITAAIYKQAEEFSKSLPAENPNQGRFSLIAKNSSSDKQAAQDQYLKQLSNSVVSSVTSLFHDSSSPGDKTHP